ncbi:MAG TPA: hypothetical protein VGI70_08095 [Polyangiales bacterium]
MLSALASTCAHAQQPRSVVVFFAPAELPADTRTTLEDALVTQLLPLPVELQFIVRAAADGGGIEQRLDLVKRTVIEHAAVAAFWLEVRGEGHWFLSAVDAKVERVVLRPLTAKSESPEALVESVALIVRATSDAVLHGEPLPEEPHPSRSVADGGSTTPPWPVTQANEARSSLRLAASYVGTTFANRLPWQQGFGVRADWLWPSGPYVGVGYTFFSAAEFNISNINFSIDRYPISLHAGLRFPVGDWVFSGELGGEIEFRDRRTNDVTGGLEAKPAQHRTLYSVCPKLESEYAITSWFRVFVGLGADFALANFAYQLANYGPEGELLDTKVVLEPHWLRLTLNVGIAIIR